MINSPEIVQKRDHQYHLTQRTEWTPSFAHPNGEVQPIEDDIFYLLDPETYVTLDATGPCKIYLASAARYIKDPYTKERILEQRILYMHATPGSLDLEDPRVPGSLAEKLNFFERKKANLRNFGWSITRTVTMQAVDGYIGHEFQRAFIGQKPEYNGWQPKKYRIQPINTTLPSPYATATATTT